MIYTRDIIGDQLRIFAGALILGITLGFCFDFFRVFKLLFSVKKRFGAVLDVVFCLWAGFLTFSFLLNENYGIPRLYIYIGEVLGFSAWYFTVGKVIFFIAKKVKKVIDKIIGAVFTPIKRVFLKKSEKIRKISAETKNIFIKNVSNGKKLLKKKSGVVYNKLYLKGKKAFLFDKGEAGKESKGFESIGEKESSDSGSSYCLRNVSHLFSDLNTGKDK